MSISNSSDVAAALEGATRYSFVKASLANAVAGQQFSLFRATGIPIQPSIPGTSWATPVDSDTGFLTFTNPTAPAEEYLLAVDLTFATVGTIVLFDRLGHMGGLSGTVTTAQTVSGSIPASRGANADGSNVDWWLEWYSDTGGTGVNATVTYTNQNDVGSRTVVIALAATTRAGRMMQIIPTTAGDIIKSIQSVTLSATTGAAGNFGVTLTRRLGSVGTALAHINATKGPYDLPFVVIPNDAAIFGAVICSTTSTGLIQGTISLAAK